MIATSQNHRTMILEIKDGAYEPIDPADVMEK